MRKQHKEVEYAIDGCKRPFSACEQRRTLPKGSFTTDRKSTRLNSSHTVISYAVFCLKKKNKLDNFRRCTVCSAAITYIIKTSSSLGCSSVSRLNLNPINSANLLCGAHMTS